MARITRAAPHLSAEELNMRLKLDSRPWCRQRWLIIYNALVDPREARDIAKHTGTRVAMVHQVIASYNRMARRCGRDARKRRSLSPVRDLGRRASVLSAFFHASGTRGNCHGRRNQACV